MIDVEIAYWERLRAVLALVVVAEHQVLTREAHDGSRASVVGFQMQHARNSEHAPYDGNGFIVVADRDAAPSGEIEKIALGRHRIGGAAEEKNKCTSHRRKLQGLVVFVDDEDGLRKYVHPLGVARDHAVAQFKAPREG